MLYLFVSGLRVPNLLSTSKDVLPEEVPFLLRLLICRGVCRFKEFLRELGTRSGSGYTVSPKTKGKRGGLENKEVRAYKRRGLRGSRKESW